jgi:single-strand DNA-binding protein
MASFNKVILMGNLTKDPELKQTPQGVSVCRFSIAVGRKLQKDVTDFFDIVAWRQSGEFVARYFKKGNPILVLGNLQTRSYDKNGQKVNVTEIVADELSFVEKKNDDPYASNAAPSAPVAPPKFEEVENDESLPF